MFPLSLRAKLLLGVLLMLAPSLVLLFLGFQIGYAQSRETALNGLSQTGQTAAVLVDATLGEALTVAQALARDPEIRSLDPGEAQQHIGLLAGLYPQYRNVSVWDAAGNNLASLVPLAPGPPVSVADESYFQRLLATGRPQLSDVRVGRVVEQPVVVAAAPIVNGTERPRGSVQISVDLQASLAGPLAGISLHPGQAIGLADPTGRLALNTALPDLSWEQRDISSWPEVQQALAGQVVQSAVFRNPLLGDVQAAAFVPTSGYRWLVTVWWSTASAFGPIDRAFGQQLLAFGLLALLSVLGALFLSSYLVQPVRRLAAEALAVGRGEMNRRVDIRTGDELEVVGTAFNTMAQNLQEERQRREVFISTVAHELNNRITPLTGYAQLLTRHPESAAEVVPRAIVAMGREAQALHRLVADLLDVSRIEAGRFPLERELTDLVAAARAVVEAEQVATEKHRLLLEAPDRLEGEWDCDRVAQVLTNLVSNALKYSPEGGDVRLVIRRTDGEAEVCVTDQGIGMEPAAISQLFEPYSRLYTERRAKGLGLGLFIARGIVEAHGGRVWASSPGPGQGSTFCFTLPVVPPQPGPQPVE